MEMITRYGQGNDVISSELGMIEMKKILTMAQLKSIIFVFKKISDKLAQA